MAPRFTEALRGRRALILFLAGSLILCFRTKDCSVAATILPSTDPILRDVVTSRLWSGAMLSPFDNPLIWMVRFGLFLDWGDFLWLHSSCLFAPTSFYNHLASQDGQ
jgi:hypothetical protein